MFENVLASANNRANLCGVMPMGASRSGEASMLGTEQLLRTIEWHKVI
jgi:hypothetical protein